ncbi:class I adenylate-forming enzyme family protein [Acetivibrio mesophilus]|uniref:Long-chain fatty acid--CoA ligase n=1 Tax=Acetivibrio mesophilus TaxID=2487273 RepID=A0A4Q0I3J9_9FIRM|nr:class I adenylate-forming enzyme family protein [Acetivibrio mesophilus]ODM26702.1 hypothetical protein A7W90_11020 [Clostridium sp. Bc-iso-3]RXE58275.1 long-chain fatty acid--CoA ligase [Acetivibrio mesophilus]HHV30586.1 acyl--CoA ligase [Clostridium sp.]HOA80873.1 class I adenylate-forming enzyme family protein [Defluviitaleaceae bacterium]
MLDFIKKCEENREHIFIIEPFTQRTVTYGQLLNCCMILKDELTQMGVSKGDRIVLSFRNEIEYVISYFSVLCLGAIPVPVNPDVKSTEIQSIVSDTLASIILTRSREEEKSHSLSSLVHYVEMESFLNRERHAEDTINTEFEYSETAAIMYTSGTTGKPKGVVLKLKAVLNGFREFGEDFDFDANTRIIQPMPVYHADGWCFSTLLPFLFGSTVILAPDFGTYVALNFDKLVCDFKGNTMICVPSMLSLLIAVKDRFDDKIKGMLKHVLCGSARLDPEILFRFEAEYNTKVYDNYGLTETLLIAYYSPKIEYRCGSVGKIPKNREVCIAEDGEILVSSEFLFGGYYNNTISTSKVYDGKWFYTGDTGYIDEDNYLYLTGRKKEIINKGGIKVYPNEVSETILRYPGIIDVATIGFEDEMYGEEIYSFVVSSPDVDISEEKVLSYVKQNISQLKCPKKIIFIDIIPKNELGKVNYKVLQEKLKQVL